MAAATLVMERTDSSPRTAPTCPRCGAALATTASHVARCTRCDYARVSAPPGPSVVIVDDNPDIRLILRHEFASQGFDVAGEATNGRDAIDLASRTHPDFLVLDLMMPEMDGVEALPAIRATSPETHIVAFTSASDGDLATSARRLGAAVYDKGAEITTLPTRLLRAAR